MATFNAGSSPQHLTVPGTSQNQTYNTNRTFDAGNCVPCQANRTYNANSPNRTFVGRSPHRTTVSANPNRTFTSNPNRTYVTASNVAHGPAPNATYLAMPNATYDAGPNRTYNANATEPSDDTTYVNPPSFRSPAGRPHNMTYIGTDCSRNSGTRGNPKSNSRNSRTGNGSTGNAGTGAQNTFDVALPNFDEAGNQFGPHQPLVPYTADQITLLTRIEVVCTEIRSFIMSVYKFFCNNHNCNWNSVYKLLGEIDLVTQSMLNEIFLQQMRVDDIRECSIRSSYAGPSIRLPSQLSESSESSESIIDDLQRRADLMNINSHSTGSLVEGLRNIEQAETNLRRFRNMSNLASSGLS